jgi:hypothetical protein
MLDLKVWLENINDVLVVVMGLLGTMLLLTGKLQEVWNKILKPLWDKILKPGLKFLGFGATLIIPSGIIMWYFLYLAAKNSNRLGEPVVLLWLIVQSTLALSAYGIIWGVWLCPKFLSFLVKQDQNADR